MRGPKDRKFAASGRERILARLRLGPATASELRDIYPHVTPAMHHLRHKNGHHIVCHRVDRAEEGVYELAALSMNVPVTPTMVREYYTSPHWQALRQRRIEYDDHKCCLCPKQADLEVHHWTFERLFNELLSDVATLCTACHVDIHRHIEGMHFPFSVSPQIAARLNAVGPGQVLTPDRDRPNPTEGQNPPC